MNKVKIICPHCGEETLPRKKIVSLDNLKSDCVVVCIFCGGVVDEGIPCEHVKRNGDVELGALSRLLGGVEEEHEVKLEATEEEKRFCRDCADYVAHPFLSRCNKFHKQADPMGDCSSWQPKHKTETGEEHDHF